jgi:hypothetical protein
VNRHLTRALIVAATFFVGLGVVATHGALAQNNPNAFNRLMKPASERVTEITLGELRRLESSHR